MQDFMYSTIGVIALVIHLIINPSLFKREKKATRKAFFYRYLMLAFFAYYITDAFWGFFGGLNNIPLLFLDTTIYFVAMAAAVVCWAGYVIEYLELRNFFGKFLKYVTLTFFAVYTVCLVVNFFIPCVFWFDENDVYVAGSIRYAALWIQIVLFFVTVLITGWKTLRASGITRKRLFAVCLCSIDMVFALYFQILEPLYPIYAMGCLVGSCILHVYIVEDEREEYRKMIAEEKAIAEQANQAKTSFLFNMSHDIRTPMNAIIGFTAMAKKHTEEPERVSDYLNKIDLAGNQLLKLINQVLEMARIESGKIELSEHPVDLTEKRSFFQAIYGDTARAKDVTFTVLPADIQHRYIIIDEDHMDQITNNIISNAIKYTPAGGSVTYYTKEEPYDRPGYGMYVITIQDTGIGMSPEFLEHVFDEFSRENTSTVTKIQGTGLGMSIVKKVSDLMGGSVKIESEKNKGTKVIISMPMKFDPNQGHAAESVVGPDSDIVLDGLKILLVEDNEMNREIASEILEERGIILDYADDGDVAVEKVKNSKPGDYDLILMDVQMPKMNGYDATRAIRALEDKALSEIPIVAMTANAFEEDKKNAMDAGMNGHFSKPIDIPKLIKILALFKDK